MCSDFLFWECFNIIATWAGKHRNATFPKMLPLRELEFFRHHLSERWPLELTIPVDLSDLTTKCLQSCPSQVSGTEKRSQAENSSKLRAPPPSRTSQLWAWADPTAPKLKPMDPWVSWSYFGKSWTKTWEKLIMFFPSWEFIFWISVWNSNGYWGASSPLRHHKESKIQTVLSGRLWTTKRSELVPMIPGYWKISVQWIGHHMFDSSSSLSTPHEGRILSVKFNWSVVGMLISHYFGKSGEPSHLVVTQETIKICSLKSVHIAPISGPK